MEEELLPTLKKTKVEVDLPLDMSLPEMLDEMLAAKSEKVSSIVDGRRLTRVDLHPDGAEEQSFHTIQCFIDADALEVVRMVVKGREGTDVVYRIDSFEGNALVPEGAFTFDVTKHPGTTVIDNRL